MKKTANLDLIRLRFIVGYLGEQLQPTWWSSSFLAPVSTMFLSPIFSKTALLAQYHGIREAAARIHDEHIGIGKGVFHLFRLPDTLEQELHSLLRESDVIDQVNREISNKPDAHNALKSLGNGESLQAVGPLRIGGRQDINKMESWRTVADYYQQAFEMQSQIFPFFSEGK